MMVSEINEEGSNHIGFVARGFWRYLDVARLHRNIRPESGLRRTYNHIAIVQLAVVALVITEVVRNSSRA